MRFLRLPLLGAMLTMLVISPLTPLANHTVRAQEPASPPSGTQNQSQTRLVESVDFQGNRRQRDEDLLFYVQTRAGEPYNPAVVQKDLEALLALPFFDKTETKVLTQEGARGGVDVIFEVKELPIIRDLQFKGLKAVTEADILKAFRENRIGIAKENVFDEVKVNNSKRLMRELLASKGYPNAKIDVTSDDVSLTSVAVTYNVDQGERVRVVEIDFEGNEIFKDDELRDQMKYVKEAGLISRLKGEDVLDTRKLEVDLFNVINYMRSKGYLQARAGEPRVEGIGQKRTGFFLPLPIVSSVDDALRVTIPVTEGKVYRVSEVKVEGNSIFDETVIRAVLGIQPGEIANGQRLGKALNEDLKRLYESRGFIQYEPDTEPTFRDNPNNPNEGLVDFTVTINEGRQFTVRRIEFQGNTFTRDNVLRRQILINEGDVYNGVDFENSILRLNQLGYFDPIDKDKDRDIRTNEETGEVDLTVRVAERGRQQISFNGGVSGIGGSFFGLEYSTNNLFGRGEILSLNFAFGNRQRSLFFSFTEPYFRNREISLGFTAFATSNKFLGPGTFLSNNFDAINSASNFLDFANLADENLFTSTTKGGSIFLSAPLAEFRRRRTRFNLLSRLGLSYSLASTSVRDPEVNQTGDAARFIPIIFSQPSILTSRVTPTYSFSSVQRNGVDGITGREVALSMAFAGLGGDVRTYQPFVTYTEFRPVRRKRTNNPEVFAFRVQAGHIASFGVTDAIRNANSLAFINGVPVNERFFLGDEFTVRGYDIRRITPYAPTSTFVTSRNVVVATNPSGTPIPVQLDTPQQTQVLQDFAQNGVFNGIQGGIQQALAASFTPIGGDTQLLGNFEYRIPIFGPVSFAAFADIGSAFNMRNGADQSINSNFFGDDVFLNTVGSVIVPGQLANQTLLPASLDRLVVRDSGRESGDPLALSRGGFGGLVRRGNQIVRLSELNQALSNADPGSINAVTGLPLGFDEVFLRGEVQANTLVGTSNPIFGKIGDFRTSLGGELRVQVPVVNVPFRLIYAFNPNSKLELGERRTAFRFSIGRTF